MLITLAGRYHRKLCQLGSGTEPARLAYIAPAVSIPWSVALLPGMACAFLLDTGKTIPLSYADSSILRWILLAGLAIPLVGMAYANITVLVCCFRTEARRNQ